MSYVQPSGTIQLFKNVPIDNRYIHTLYFASPSAQTEYFNGLVNSTLNFSNQSYSRVNKGSVRVKINSESCQSVTYMRFNNRGTKWYYCFVNGIEYVNENTTDIYYEIDVIQTWLIQCADSPEQAIKACFVEREHVTTDTPFSNLESEPVGSTVYDIDEITPANMKSDFGKYSWVLTNSSGADVGGDDMRAGKYDGIFVGGALFSGDSTSALASNIEKALGSWDIQEQSGTITDLHMFPSAYIGSNLIEKTYNLQIPTKFDNYTPQNNKLFSYPYSFLTMSTGDGNTAQYRWEYFDVTTGSTIQFRGEGCRVGGGQIALMPTVYNGVTDNFDAKLVMNNFPKCSSAYDAYQAFIASGGQTKLDYNQGVLNKRGAIQVNQLNTDAGFTMVQDAISLGKQINSLANSGSSGQVINNSLGLANSIMTGVQDAMNAGYRYQLLDLSLDEAQHKIDFAFKDATYAPNVMVGEASPSVAVGHSHLGFRAYHVHIRDDEMVRIDDFFSVYGYAVNKVKVPNLHGRPYWNFVKTQNANVIGEMPASSRAAICRILDGGIFFWNTSRGLNNVGNFGQSHASSGAIVNK